LDKIDFKKRYKSLFAPKKKPHFVDVPPFHYLMIDGKGAPESQLFQDALAALYSMAYTVKFMLKSAGRTDFVVPPLETLWWAEDVRAFHENDRDEWQWTMMIMQPDQVTPSDLDRGLDQLEEKNKRSPAHDRLRLATLEEGRAVQVMHVGPYSEEEPTIAAMHTFTESAGYKLVGKHHEIYLSDPRRSAPEKLRTVLRHPVA
jgi:hypothetical protein